MLVDLSHDDLICLVAGTSPDITKINEYIDYGAYYDAWGWTWRKGSLNQLSDEQLLSMYYKLMEVK